VEEEAAIEGVRHYCDYRHCAVGHEGAGTERGHRAVNLKIMLCLHAA